MGGKNIKSDDLKKFIESLEENMDSGVEMTGWDVCHLIRNQFVLDRKKGKTLMEVFAEQESVEPQKGFDPRPLEVLLKQEASTPMPTTKLHKNWSKVKRSSGLIEWICPHGNGHPDASSASAMDKKYNHKAGTWSTHGCGCGCCQKADFPGKIQKKG